MAEDILADYVIVGGGSAGCVLANRLSEDPEVSVLLLEAGGKDRSPIISAPGGLLPIMFGGLFQWMHVSVPQKHADGRVMYSPRGKALGGSSSINGMIYDRGSRHDYDRWAQLGNRGWSYDDVLPYFRKLENYHGGADEFHGEGGPVQVTRPGIHHPLGQAFRDAAVAAGLPYNTDMNGAEREGVGPTDVTVGGGRRSSSARAYLHPIAKRSNLRVVTGAHATRLVLREGRATGVGYRQKGKTGRALARREVILSAGAIHTPHLLMLSGVGDGAHLKEHGIEVQHHLSGVGQNYSEHTAVAVKYRCSQPISLYNFLNPLRAGLEVGKYLFLNKGMLAQPPMEVVAYMKVMPGADQPDIKIHFTMALYEQMGRKLDMQHGFFAHIDLLGVDSVGEIKLTSADPFAPLAIDPNILSSPRDMAHGRAAIRAVRDIFAQQPMDPYRGDELAPGATLISDDELDAYLRETATPDIHTSGTCRMGSDPMAVVDDQLRVHGVQNLRIVDASVMPFVPGGNTNVPVMMVAEKAADLIRGTVTVEQAGV